MKEIKLDKNKSTIKQDISMCSNSEIVNTNFNNCSTRDTVLNQKIENETERAINKETELEEKIKESGKIDDVLVNGESVVEDKIAKIDLTSYATKSDVENETERAKEAEESINNDLHTNYVDLSNEQTITGIKHFKVGDTSTENLALYEKDTVLEKVATFKAGVNIDSFAYGSYTISSSSDKNILTTKWYVDNSLSTEATARKNADTNLQNQINTNKNDISDLRLDLSDETEARTEADSSLDSKISTNLNNINNINSKIPSEASSSNLLADKNWVNDNLNNYVDLNNTQIISGEKHFRTGNSDGLENIVTYADNTILEKPVQIKVGRTELSNFVGYEADTFLEKPTIIKAGGGNNYNIEARETYTNFGKVATFNAGANFDLFTYANYTVDSNSDNKTLIYKGYLDNQILSEATNRESADNTLQENIDNLIVDGGELVYE